MARRKSSTDTSDILENKPRRSRRTQRGDIFTLEKILPMNARQKQMMNAFENGKNIIGVGSAGSGKSYIACYLALKQLISGEISKIIIARSAVNVRNIGHLPGSIDEKVSIYGLPFKTIIDKLCGCGTAWDSLVRKGYIEFITTSYIRGLTLENCVVIIDELQNMDPQECESLLTRLGENCQVILCGDTRQNDLFRKREISCYEWLLKVVGKLEEYFEVIHFTSEDIVRSEICKAIIMAIEDGV